MKNTASDGAGLSRLESSFSFKPKNRRKSDNHPHEVDRTIEPGNLPRISKLMALAIRFDGLVQRGEVRDYADLATVSYTHLDVYKRQGSNPVSPTRNLLNGYNRWTGL